MLENNGMIKLVLNKRMEGADEKATRFGYSIIFNGMRKPSFNK
ncbi:hypothetical protein GCM10010954_11970 [Halobacillus andaensis]|uniref:Uncharacterized protein n=1 Tax=Halobacillus andaensis TaxID=1176239 RepID=A0A917B291_HALAA|nr:hypothetical protein GCM10010954_11970 [Halobacillus andaensis]